MRTMKNYSKLTPEGTRDVLFEASEAKHILKKISVPSFIAEGSVKYVPQGLNFLTFLVKWEIFPC